MKYYVVANWKCYKTTADGRLWLDQFSAQYRARSGLEIIVAPTSLSLESLSLHLEKGKSPVVRLAAQDVSPFPRGGYTGAVAADMLAPYVNYVIVGHSERRRYFHESSQDVVNKVQEAVDSDLTPIVCVDGTSSLSQLSPLVDLDCDRILIAYCPVDAVHFRITEDPHRVEDGAGHIAKMFPQWPVIYGGALNADNIDNYLRITTLSGLFVGAASLEVADFLAICSRVSESR